ncbi:4362_t:CDS:2 [Acaulospora morrowiae]|uniref:RecQ-mediated genome instability protein 1 n=1 Tax=Acaulospora morrowiae TaxID=94023 RepID=A0A9N9AHG9_9GLOM|nr:4362_t:CDS:2 [Acaulospora morrowiae]
MSFLFVKDRFEKINVQLQESWLKQCLDKLRHKPEYQNANNQRLYQAVYEEFLESDLRQSMKPLLPLSIDDAHKTIIGENRPITLQIVEIFEVGVSNQTLFDTISSHLSGSIKEGHKYSDVRDKQNEPIKFPKAMLKFYLTDGTQIVDAIEFKPLSQLDLLTPIGTKISVRRTLILRGVLCLEPQKVSVLGGFSNVSRSINNIQNQLEKRLGLPVTEYPREGQNVQGPNSISEENQSRHSSSNSIVSVGVNARANVISNGGLDSNLHLGNQNSTASNHNAATLVSKNDSLSTGLSNKAMTTDRINHVTINYRSSQNSNTSFSSTENISLSRNNTSLSTQTENTEPSQIQSTPRSKNNAQQLFNMFDQLWDKDELDNISFINSQVMSTNDNMHDGIPKDNNENCNSPNSSNKGKSHHKNNKLSVVDSKEDDVNMSSSNLHVSNEPHMENRITGDNNLFLMDDIEYDSSFMNFQDEGFEPAKICPNLREVGAFDVNSSNFRNSDGLGKSLKHKLGEDDLMEDEKPNEKKRCINNDDDLLGFDDFNPIELDDFELFVEDEIRQSGSTTEKSSHMSKNRDSVVTSSMNFGDPTKQDNSEKSSVPNEEQLREETSPTSSPPIISSMECFQLPAGSFDDISPIATYENTFNDITSLIDMPSSSALTDKGMSSNKPIKPTDSNGDVVVISDDEEENVMNNDLGEQLDRYNLIFDMSQDEELPSEEDLVRTSIFKNRSSARKI